MIECDQSSPGYHQGFHDAAGLEPLFEDAAPEYEQGWRAYWVCREKLEEIETLAQKEKVD